ncbi:uncharacterized protein TNCV_992961 [Trichonephila clavipes]|nr:uncharacterized protein TNCV_992961 [Trichonephila clavipes]
MYIYTFQDALFIYYKHSLDNARSIAFSQRSIGTHLIEDETVNESDTTNNLIVYEDGLKEQDSLRADKIYAVIQLSNQLEMHFLKIGTISESNLEFPKQLQFCISGYCDFHKQLTN